MNKKIRAGLTRIIEKYCASRIKTVQDLKLSSLPINRRSIMMLMTLRGVTTVEGLISSCMDLKLERDITTSSGSMYEDIIAYISGGQRLLTRADKEKYPGIDVKFYSNQFKRVFLGQIKSTEWAFNSGAYYDTSKRLELTGESCKSALIFVGIADGSKDSNNTYVKKLGSKYLLFFDDELYRFASNNKVTGSDITEVILDTADKFSVDGINLSRAITIKLSELSAECLQVHGDGIQAALRKGPRKENP